MHHRKLKALSQAKLRDKIEAWGHRYDKSAISKWETGLHIPSAEVVEILEDILLPKSNGLLLKTAGYHYQAEDSYQLVEYTKEEQSSQSKELQTTALIIASNLEKFRNAPSPALGDPFGHSAYPVGELVYGGWWIYEEDRAKLGDVDRELAPELLKLLKEEGDFPELVDIDDWSELNYDLITESFIQRLTVRAYRGNF